MTRGSGWLMMALASCGGAAQSASAPAHESAPASIVDITEPTPASAEPPVEAVPVVATTPAPIDDCVAELRAGNWATATEDERERYRRALDAERVSDLKTARLEYFELVKQSPRSGLVPLAYLAFGEMFSVEAEGDPSKRPVALAALREVLKYPPPANTAYAYAALRAARVQNGDTEALADFVRALDATKQHPAAPCAESVARAARDGMVQTYARAGRPDRAAPFFRAKAPDHEAPMLRALFDAYRDKGDATAACALAKASLPDQVKTACP